MNSDLIVMTFDDGEMAQTVHSSLQTMRKSQVFGLGDSVILSKDGDGQTRLHPGSSASASLAGPLAQRVFCMERVGLDGVDFQLDERFLEPVLLALCESSSAILFFVGSDSLSDAGELLSVLALFRGTIHQTTLSPKDEASLRRML